MVSYIPYWSYVRYMQAGVQCAAPTGRGVALEIEDRGGKTAAMCNNDGFDINYNREKSQF
jgi:hypothetical protein